MTDHARQIGGGRRLIGGFALKLAESEGDDSGDGRTAGVLDVRREGRASS